MLKELKARKIVGAKTRAQKLFLRNYDALVIPGALVAGEPGRSRLALHALAAPVFGRHAVTDGELARLAAAWKHEKADHLVSSLAGNAFQRQDLMRWSAKQLRARGIEVGEGGERPCWLIVVDEAFYFAFPRFNHHDAAGRARDVDRAGALPATVAAAAVFAAKLGPSEVIWDPVAGSGTLLREAQAASPAAVLIGADVDADAVATARRLLGPGPRLEVADAAAIDLGRADVTLTLANLPWGRQYESQGGNAAFYEAVLKSSLAHAAQGWRGVFVTSDEEALRRAARALRLKLELVARPKVRGVEAGIWLACP